MTGDTVSILIRNIGSVFTPLHDVTYKKRVNVPRNKFSGITGKVYAMKA